MQAHASTSKDESRSRFTTSNVQVERHAAAQTKSKLLYLHSPSPSDDQRRRRRVSAPTQVRYLFLGRFGQRKYLWDEIGREVCCQLFRRCQYLLFWKEPSNPTFKVLPRHHSRDTSLVHSGVRRRSSQPEIIDRTLRAIFRWAREHGFNIDCDFLGMKFVSEVVVEIMHYRIMTLRT
jgi:hypothetical protein